MVVRIRMVYQDLRANIGVEGEASYGHVDCHDGVHCRYQRLRQAPRLNANMHGVRFENFQQFDSLGYACGSRQLKVQRYTCLIVYFVRYCTAIYIRVHW